MLFTSLEFIMFILGVFVLYYIVPKRFQWRLLLAANVFFYACAGMGGMVFMGVTIVTSYAAAVCMDRLQKKADSYIQSQKGIWTKEERKAYKKHVKKRKRNVLLSCLFINIGILAALKYTNFAIANINGIATAFTGSRVLAYTDFVLPLGISFYTFQTMGYVIDVYRKKAEAEKNIFKMALFVSFFPQLIQGPISRFGELKETLYKEHKFVFKTVLFGAERILWGYFKKLVIADRILAAVNIIIGQPLEYYGFYVFLGMIFYAVELYADFTGGIDITIGIAQVLGINVAENFERPYFSKSIAEYWRRWHITMGTWFRDYIYYPMSASVTVMKFSTFARKHFGETVGRRLPLYFVMFTVWFATGIWHGASWNFIVWGLLNCSVILISQECRPLYEKFHARFPKLKDKFGYKCFQIIRTILLMSVLRLLDCYRNVPLTFYMFGTIFTHINISSVFGGGLLTLGIKVYDYVVIGLGVLLLYMVSILQRKGSVRERLYKKPVIVQYLAVLFLLAAIIVFGAYGIGYDANQFIYNQF